MAGPVLVIKKVFSAKPEQVFEAWTDPEQVAAWYGPEGFAKSDIHAFDLREGGAYSLTMNAPDGKEHKLRGVFKKINKPYELAFTWQWEEGGKDNMPGDETLVTVELKPVGEETEMTFTHSGFATESARDGHNAGWTGSFNKLEKYLA